jgi:hypothetical protein
MFGPGVSVSAEQKEKEGQAELKRGSGVQAAGAPVDASGGAAAAGNDDPLLRLAADLWGADKISLEWPNDAPDPKAPITCLACMERTHAPGACERVPTSECTVLRCVFGTPVGNRWLEACDLLAAECKVLRWGTGMAANGRDGSARMVHFLWWTSAPDTVAAEIGKSSPSLAALTSRTINAAQVPIFSNRQPTAAANVVATSTNGLSSALSWRCPPSV